MRVNLVSPGPVAGERLDGVLRAQGPGAEEAFLAGLAAGALRHARGRRRGRAVPVLERAAAITGEDLNVSGGTVMHG